MFKNLIILFGAAMTIDGFAAENFSNAKEPLISDALSANMSYITHNCLAEHCKRNHINHAAEGDTLYLEKSVNPLPDGLLCLADSEESEGSETALAPFKKVQSQELTSFSRSKNLTREIGLEKNTTLWSVAEELHHGLESLKKLSNQPHVKLNLSTWHYSSGFDLTRYTSLFRSSAFSMVEYLDLSGQENASWALLFSQSKTLTSLKFLIMDDVCLNDNVMGNWEGKNSIVLPSLDLHKVPGLPEFSNLEFLSINKTQINAYHLIRFVKAAPRLKTLLCCDHSMGECDANVLMSEHLGEAFVYMPYEDDNCEIGTLLDIKRLSKTPSKTFVSLEHFYLYDSSVYRNEKGQFVSNISDDTKQKLRTAFGGRIHI